MENEMREIEKIVLKYGDIQSLIHYINVETLKKEHDRQKENNAPGIDKITKEKYNVKNIENLVERMKKFSYNPLPVKEHTYQKATEIKDHLEYQRMKIN